MGGTRDDRDNDNGNDAGVPAAAKKSLFFLKTRPQHVLAQLAQEGASGSDGHVSKHIINIDDEPSEGPQTVIEINDDDSDGDEASDASGAGGRLDPELERILLQARRGSNVSADAGPAAATDLSVHVHLESVSHLNSSFVLPAVPAATAVHSVLQTVAGRVGQQGLCGYLRTASDGMLVRVYGGASIGSLGLAAGQPLLVLGAAVPAGPHVDSSAAHSPSAEEPVGHHTVALKVRTGREEWQTVSVDGSAPLLAQLEGSVPAARGFVVDGMAVAEGCSANSLGLEDGDIVECIK